MGAATFRLLASDDSSSVCGSELPVDGGMLAGQYYAGMPGEPRARVSQG